MAKNKDKTVLDDSDLQTLKDFFQDTLKRSEERQVSRKKSMTDLADAKERHDLKKWMSAENIINNNKKRLTIDYNNSRNAYTCEVYSNFKHDILIRSEYDNVLVPGSNFGLFCDVIVETGHASGYHNSDCGDYEGFKLISDNLLTLINEVSRFCTHISMDDIPTDGLLTAVFPATLQNTLLKE